MLKILNTSLFVGLLSTVATSQLPVLLKDIRSGGGSMEQTSTFTAVGKNKVMFFAKDNSHGIEPWISDGTEAGTMLLSDLDGSPAPSFPFDYSTAVDETVGKTYFTAYNNGTNLGIYVTDGTSAGTKLFYQPDAFPYHLHFFGNKLYYTNKDFGLSTSDGTTGGTKDVIEKTLKVYPLGIVGAKLYCSVNDPSNGTWSLYSVATNGAATKEAFKQSASSDEILSIYEGKAGLYISAGNNQNADIFHYTPASSKTTKLLSKTGDFVRNFSVFKGKDYFLVNNKFYESDGSVAGTKLLKTFNHLSFTWTKERFVKTDNFLFMSGETSTEGDELWAYNPTVGMVNIDIMTGSESSSPNNMVSVGNKIYFTAKTLDKGNELMVSDGTKTGTKVVADLNEGANDAFPFGLVLIKLGTKSYLFFKATDTNVGDEPFKMEVQVVSPTKEIAQKVQNELKVFPNPTNGQISISVSDASVLSPKTWVLRDIFGREVAKGDCNNMENEFSLALPSSLTTGNYYFSVMDISGNQVTKQLKVMK